MKFMYSILVSCLLFIGQAQAANFNLLDATSFDPQPVVVSAADNSVPIGTVIIWTKEIIPEGWLECDGQAVNETLYPDLHKLMPIVPNYQGMFLRGAGSQTFIQSNGSLVGNVITNHSSGTLGQIQGDAIRNLTGDLPGSDNSGGSWNWNNGAFYAIAGRHGPLGFDSASGGATIKFNISRVAPTANEIRPVNMAVKYIIKAE